MDSRRLLLEANNSAPRVLPETALIVAQMSTPPTAARVALINDTIRRLKTAGIWTLLDLFYMLAGAASDHALINWKTPGTNTLSSSGTPTFTADRGWTGNGVDGLLSAAYTNTLYTQNDAHVACFGLTNTAGGIADFAITNSTPAVRAQSQVRNSTGARISLSNTTTTPALNINVTVPKMVAGDRSDGSNQSLYINGQFDQTTAVASVATVAATANFLGTGAGSFSDRQIAFGCCGAALGASGHRDLDTIVRAYLTSVGAI